MFTRRDPFPFRPAPFPVYPDDASPGRLRCARSLAALLCGLTALVPLLAGPSNELSVPVSYARIELAERAPAVLQLDLPAADYHVAPASLGYFANDGSLVYTADVARGVVYARQPAGIVVLEVTVSPRAETYLAQQLDLIKQGVSEVNARQNALLLAREQDPATPSLSRTYSALWESLGPDLAGSPPMDWAEATELTAEDAAELRRELSARARHRARLKDLYYEVQSARLRLMLAQYDLQLALARLPRPDIEGLISLGDTGVVQDTLEVEIQRLRSTWSARLATLSRRRTADLARLDSLQQNAADDLRDTVAAVSPFAFAGPVTPEASFPHDPLQPSLTDQSGAELEPATASPQSRQPSPANELEAGLLRARIVIAGAELEAIRERLNELTAAEQHVAGDSLPRWADLPRVTPKLERLQLNGLEELAEFAMVEQAARRSETAVPLLLELARCFESPELMGGNAQQSSWTPHPDEVAYGLFIVDRCQLGPVEDNADDDAGPRGGEQLVERLDTVIGFPADFEMAQYDLGYLQFLRWYAELDKDALQPRAEPAGPADDGAAESHTPEETRKHRADVDELFN